MNWRETNRYMMHNRWSAPVEYMIDSYYSVHDRQLDVLPDGKFFEHFWNGKPMSTVGRGLEDRLADGIDFYWSRKRDGKNGNV